MQRVIKLLTTRLSKARSEDFSSNRDLYIFLSIAVFTLVFGIYLRFRGIGWGTIDLPWIKSTYNFDEHKVIDTISHFTPFNWAVRDFRLGTLHFYLVAVALKIAEWIGYLSFYQQQEIDAAKVFVVGRLVSVILGLLTIPLVYLTGNKVGGLKAGILSAAFFCILPLHVINSHFVAPDVSMCFFVMLTFYITLVTLERESKITYSLQGLFCGLAVATKYSAAPIAIVIVLAHLLQKDISWKKKSITYPFMLLGFIVGEPYAIVFFNKFINDIRGMGSAHTSGEGGLIATMVMNIWFYGKNIALYCMGIPLFIISLLGIPQLIKHKSHANTLILASIVAFFIFALISKFQFIRFSLPLIIFLCISCAINLVSLKRIKARYVRFGLCASFCLVLSLANTNIMTKEHTATAAYKWIDENVEPGSIIFQEWKEIPPLQPRRYNVYDYKLIAPERGFILKPDYVIRTDLTPIFDNEHLLEQLDTHYKLLVTFEKSPPTFLMAMDDNAPYDLQYTHPKISIYGLSTTLATLSTNKYSVNSKTINFKDKTSQKYLRRGWSQTEDYGTWSVGMESVMIVYFKENGNYIMRVKATPYTISDRRQTVKMFINDEYVGEHTFDKPFMQWETFEVTIPAECLISGTTRIKFIYSYAISPKNANRGPDLRKLAVAFESIEFIKS